MYWSAITQLGALLLDVFMARRQPACAKDLEIAVLRHQLRMLEFFQPSPKTGTGGAYARAQQNLEPPYKHGRDELLGRWPMAADEAAKGQTMWAIREADILWRLEGGTRGRELLVGIMASTEHMTVGKIEFLGGQRSGEFVHQGGKVIFLEAGNLHIEFPDTRRWVELNAWDGCRIPAMP